jgi:hypothetical protein
VVALIPLMREDIFVERRSVMAIEIQVGTEVCHYPYTGGMYPTRVKRKVTKVTASGRFYIEGSDVQWTPREHHSSSGHKWSASNRNLDRQSVVPWDDHIEAAIAQRNNQLKYTQKIHMIQAAIAKLHYTEEARIDNLFRLLELDHEQLK